MDNTQMNQAPAGPAGKRTNPLASEPVGRLLVQYALPSILSTLMASARMEYYTMVGLVVGNIPLLYILNKDWFHTLVFETPGKIVLGVCGAVIFVTYLFMLKFTKPATYKT